MIPARLEWVCWLSRQPAYPLQSGLNEGTQPMDGLRKGNPVYFLQWMRLKGGLTNFMASR